MNRLYLYAAVVAALFGGGFGLGWHAKSNRVNAAVVRQVVQTARVDAKNQTDVEKQDDSDRTKVSQLEAELDAARRAAAARGVPKLARHGCVPGPQADAGPREAVGAAGRPPAGDAGEDPEVRGYQELRDELLTAAAVTARLRLQVLACQAQWPTR